MLIVFGGKNKNDYVVIDEMDIKDGEHVTVPDPQTKKLKILAPSKVKL